MQKSLPTRIGNRCSLLDVSCTKERIVERQKWTDYWRADWEVDEEFEFNARESGQTHTHIGFNHAQKQEKKGSNDEIMITKPKGSSSINREIHKGRK